jgi:hypothetical protein
MSDEGKALIAEKKRQDWELWKSKLALIDQIIEEYERDQTDDQFLDKISQLIEDFVTVEKVA